MVIAINKKKEGREEGGGGEEGKGDGDGDGDGEVTLQGEEGQWVVRGERSTRIWLLHLGHLGSVLEGNTYIKQ